MGAKNPDRIPLQHRRHGCETVGQMIEQRWDVISNCRHCGLQMRVDLKLIAIVRGPGVSLWNVKARCKRLLCPGVVEFHAKAPGMAWHEELRADDREVERVPRWLVARGLKTEPPG